MRRPKELKKNSPCIIIRTAACPGPRLGANLGLLPFSDCSAACRDYPRCLYQLNWFARLNPTVTNFSRSSNLQSAYFSPCHLGPTSSNPRGWPTSTTTFESIRSRYENERTWARSDNSVPFWMLKTSLTCSLSESFDCPNRSACELWSTFTASWSFRCWFSSGPFWYLTQSATYVSIYFCRECDFAPQTLAGTHSAISWSCPSFSNATFESTSCPCSRVS